VELGWGRGTAADNWGYADREPMEAQVAIRRIIFSNGKVNLADVKYVGFHALVGTLVLGECTFAESGEKGQGFRE
jgi:hypothetical protein